jgi:lipopolysaccharide transport system ATP-binding protein
MLDTVIHAEGLGKKYTIGHHAEKQSYRALRDVLAQGARRFWQKSGDLLRGNPIIQGDTLEDVWALKDLTFEIKRGEVVGIIGRNGAGKSTLLKILSRITEPSAGRVMIRGRVASLLEVGTGFHPELTGRENIYLNGTILGMTRREVRGKFDEIVAFAEVERYLDTPVKRYSSGMYVRLAFAVAAHLEPEILVVDEVLAVGDASFQRKCLGKMGSVAKEGRTVLFVSHNMAAVLQLCRRGMVLTDGRLESFDPMDKAVRRYLEAVQASTCGIDLASRKDRKGSQRLRFTKVAVYDAEDHELHHVMTGQDVRIRLYYVADYVKAKACVLVSFNVRSDQGYLLTNLNSEDAGNSELDIAASGYFECSWPRFNLRSGSYDCNLFCSDAGEILDWLQNAFVLRVEDGDYFKTGKLVSRSQGDLVVEHRWKGVSGEPH